MLLLFLCTLLFTDFAFPHFFPKRVYMTRKIQIYLESFHYQQEQQKRKSSTNIITYYSYVILANMQFTATNFRFVSC